MKVALRVVCVSVRTTMSKGDLQRDLPSVKRCVCVVCVCVCARACVPSDADLNRPMHTQTRMYTHTHTHERERERERERETGGIGGGKRGVSIVLLHFIITFYHYRRNSRRVTRPSLSASKV